MIVMKINHVTYTVSDISEAVLFYNKIFDCQPVAISKSLAYYDLDGLWFALNFEENPTESYRHIAFDCDDLDVLKARFDRLDIVYTEGRKRHCDEKPSIYLKDPDGNLIEFHTGTLKDRITYYKKRKDITIL